MPSISRVEALRVGLAVVVTGGLLALVARSVDGERLVSLLAGVRPLGVVLAVAAVPVQVALAAWRWRTASLGLGIELGRVEAFAETGLAILVNQLLPSGLAGEVVRVWRQRGRRRPTSAIVGAAVTDRGLGFAAFLVTLGASVVAWPFVHRGMPPFVPVGLALGAGALWGMVLVDPDRWPWIGEVARAVREVALDPRNATVLIATSGALMVAIFVQAALCAWALELPRVFGMLTLLPLYLLSMLIPLSVGGWGPKEAAALGLFPMVGWSTTEAAALSTLFGVTTLLGSASFGLVPLVMRGRR